MNKEEFEEKYSDVDLYFKSYYKYGFTFEGTAEDGTRIEAYRGGGADSVYRYEVKPDVPKKVGNKLELSWDNVHAYDGNEEIFEFIAGW